MKVAILKSASCDGLDGKYTIEASVARFPVGKWPSEVIFDSDRLFLIQFEKDIGEEVISAIYAKSVTDFNAGNSPILTVFND
jgi:hypothetical protein